MDPVWLRPNRRAIWLGGVPALVLLAAGLAMLGILTNPTGRVVGWMSVVAAALLLGAFGLVASLPRLAFRRGQLLVYLKVGQPICLPIDLVECFFLGQGPSSILSEPASARSEQVRTLNVIVRLSESATEWKDISVNAGLGKWQDGYITILGAWCEKITPELIQQLNEKLIAAHRAQRDAVRGDTG